MQKKNYVQEILEIIHSGLPQAELAEKLSDYHENDLPMPHRQQAISSDHQPFSPSWYNAPSPEHPLPQYNTSFITTPYSY